MSTIYKRWRIRAGMTIRFQTDARPWLPEDATLTTFNPDFTGLPFTAEAPVISNGIVQQKITANVGASVGQYTVPVALANSIGETDQQEFILEVV
jgi:hypothetical protein